MKRKILKLSTIILLFAFISAGCQKEDEIVDERYPFKLHYAIQDENGNEVSQIKEGETFFINFSIENTSDTHAAINNHHLFFNDELFNIYELANSKLIGTLVERNICTDNMGCGGQPNVKNEIAVPYPIKNDTTIEFMCCNYNLEKFPEISEGKYMVKYTGNIAYYYIKDNYEIEHHETGNYSLKYEFEIIK